MLWPLWVVLIAGSTGSALRAVRPPNLHITPDNATEPIKPGELLLRLCCKTLVETADEP